jgi:hypothetical protein
MAPCLDWKKNSTSTWQAFELAMNIASASSKVVFNHCEEFE